MALIPGITEGLAHNVAEAFAAHNRAAMEMNGEAGAGEEHAAAEGAGEDGAAAAEAAA